MPHAAGRAVVEGMVSSMLHEPFYTAERYLEPELGLYAAAIGFADAPAATLIRSAADPTLILLQSGEIVGHPEQVFELYRAKGEHFVENLNGLFSGLLIDRSARCAYLFNDRYSFQRIYLHETDDALYFASEAKALLRVLKQLRRFDEAGVADFLTFGCTTENRTLFRGISLLPAASIWRCESGNIAKRCYFSPREWEEQERVSTSEFQRLFDDAVAAVTPDYFRSDGANLGIALTAGLDSRLVLAARPKACEPPRCYTYDGPTGETLDTQLAREVANALHWPHEVVRLKQDFFSDFAAHTARTVHLTDGAFGATGAHEVYLSRAARQMAPVRLTGVFGGEIFRAVSTFKPLRLVPELLAGDVRAAVEQRSQRSPTAGDHPVSAAAFKEIPWSIFGSLAACRSQLVFRTPYLDTRLVSLAYRMPGSSGDSTQPFVSAIRRLDPALGRIPTDMGLLATASRVRRAAAKVTFKLDYLRNDGMPHWLTPAEPMLDRVGACLPLFGRHKYLRYRQWFRRELAEHVRDALASSSVRQSGLWDKPFVAGLAEAHISGRRNYVQEINAVLTLSAVQEIFVKRADSEDRAPLEAAAMTAR